MCRGNEGIDRARGELIAFLDADDCWAPGKLVAQFDYLAKHPRCMAVIGHFVRFAVAGLQAPGYTAAWLSRAEPGYTPGALLVRRGVFQEAGRFDATLRVGCDSDGFVRARDMGIEIALLPQVVLQKRIHAGNLSQQVSRYRRELLTVTRRSLVRCGIIGGVQALSPCRASSPACRPGLCPSPWSAPGHPPTDAWPVSAGGQGWKRCSGMHR